MKPNLADIAARLNLSSATISRALSRPQMVSPATLARVRAAIAELGYVPDGPARALVSRRTSTIGVIVPTLDNTMFAPAIQAMQTDCAEANYQLLVASHDYSPTVEVSALRSLMERGVDAIALVGTDRSREAWNMLAQAPMPVVITWSLYDDFDSIGFDHCRIGRLAAEHALDLGHRRIGVISGFVRHNDRARMRLEGIRACLSDAGMELAGSLVSEQPFGLAGGRAAMVQFLSMAEPPTAVMAGNDLLAIGAMIEAQARGLKIPDDMSVIGTGDLDLAAHLPPGLTTVRVPHAELGRRTADHILKRLSGQPVSSRIELSTELVVRGSTGAPRSPGGLRKGSATR